MAETPVTLPVRESAKALIVDTSRLTVLILRLNEQEREARGIDEWHIPGGSKEDSDGSFTDAAVREVQEETGIRSDQLEYLGELGGDEWDAFYEGEPTHFVAKFLAFALKAGVDVDVVISSESSGSAWITEAEMEDYPALTPQARKFIPEAIALAEGHHGR